MKITKIFIRNLNSLKGDHVIDFEKDNFRHSGLFLISGPTGAGKSTILDALSLALFNEIPRLGKVSVKTIEELGGIMTHNTDEAIAEVEYKVSEGHYRSRWSVRKTRNGTLSDYHMELTNLSSGHQYPLKKSNVPDENAKIIKLNYQQFLKAILLSQGEFAQFLKAKPEERTDLLEKLTGTFIYRQLGIKAFEKNKENTKLYDEKKWEIDQIVLLNDDQINQINQRKSEINDILKTIAGKIEENNSKLEKVRRFNQVNTQLSEKLKELQHYESRYEEFQPQIQKLDNHNRLNPFRESFTIYAEAKHFIETNTYKLVEEEERLKNNQTIIQRSLEEYAELCGSYVPLRDFLAHMKAFEDGYNKDKTTLELKKNEGSSFKSLFEEKLNNLFNNKDLNKNQFDRSNITNSLKLILSDTKSRLLGLGFNEGIELQYFQSQSKALDDDIHQSDKLLNELSVCEIYHNELKSISVELEKLSQKKKELEVSIEKNTSLMDQIQKELSSVSMQYQNLKSKEPLMDIVRNLNLGDECPICGNTIENLPHFDFTLLGMLDLKKSELESKSSEIKNKNLTDSADLKNLISNIEEKKNKYLDQKNKIPNEWSDLQKLIALKEKTVHLIHTKKEERRKLDLVFNYSNVLQQLDELLNISEMLDKLRDEYIELNNNFKNKYGDKPVNDITNDLQEKIAKATEAEHYYKGSIKTLKKSIEEKNSIFKKSDEELTEKVQSLGFPSLETALTYLLSDDELNDILKSKSSLEENLNILRGSLKSLREQIMDLNEEVAAIDLEGLESEINNLRQEEEMLNREIGALDENLTMNQNNQIRKADLTKNLEEFDRKNKKWRLLTQMIGDSEGKKFSHYAQSLTLKHLLIMANSRLRTLTDRYQFLVPETIKTDLEIRDLYQGNVKRSVKTLSGGETFILSLAMALSLSDLASKNNPIDCLFIDEGFGTLDPDTLDVAMTTLDQLQYQSQKQIGIISHVASLKDRISTQIILQRDVSGYSTIRIV